MRFAKAIVLILFFSDALFAGVSLRHFHEELGRVSLSRDISIRATALIQARIGGKPPAPFVHPEDLKIVFVGDIMLARAIGNFIDSARDPSYPFSKTAAFIKEANLAFGNLEGPISSRGRNQGSVYSFRANPKVIQRLDSAGFDILSLANNHIWDWGRDALDDTVMLLKGNGIQGIGAGLNYREANQPLIVHLGGTRIAFLAYTNLYPRTLEATETKSGVSSFEPELIKRAIFEAHDSADIVVVSLHWGNEYEIGANELQKKLAREFVNAGADIIIGHHPHVVQEVEHYKNGFIAYSLGNFVFDQNFSEDTKQGLIAEVRVKNNKIFEVRSLKVKFSDTFQPEIVDYGQLLR